MKLLVTGGSGFIGSNLVRFLLERHEDIEVVNLDLLTYAGNPENLEDLAGDPRYRFVQGDICDRALVREVATDVDAILNLAAESHVDRSVVSATPFVRTNVTGTLTLLDAALEAGVGRFLQVSTDEVYGELPWRDPSSAEPGPRFTEDTPLAPRSPYSASKAAADLL
ncbi:MAG TPA: GDP-mannose 4,6-dehydratase, partial [Longimicrobiales bacterium]|nr:GDP-mannose 4,6-dehydratase [Longimicrobiales bacterium]